MCVFVEVERRRNERRPEWEFCFIAPCWLVAWSHFFFFSLLHKTARGGGSIRSAGLRWSQPPTHPLRLPSPPNTHTQWLIDTAFGLTGPFVETPIVHGQSNWSVISRGVLRGGAVCVCVCVFDPSMQSDKDQDAEMKTNTPYVHPPSLTNTHTTTHTVVVFVLLWWVA